MPTKFKYSAAILVFVSIFGAAPALAAWPETSETFVGTYGFSAEVLAFPTSPNEFDEFVVGLRCYDEVNLDLPCADLFVPPTLRFCVNDGTSDIAGQCEPLSPEPFSPNLYYTLSDVSDIICGLDEFSITYEVVLENGTNASVYSRDDFDLSSCPPPEEPPTGTTTQIDLFNPDELQGVIIAACFLVFVTIALWPRSER